LNKEVTAESPVLSIGERLAEPRTENGRK